MKRFADRREIPMAFLGLLTPLKEGHLLVPFGKVTHHLNSRPTASTTPSGQNLYLLNRRLTVSLNTQETKTVVFATISHIQLYFVNKTVTGIRQLHVVGTCMGLSDLYFKTQMRKDG